MALIPSSRYPSQVDADGAYPQGKARNASSFQAGDGTPLERDWVNDVWGFQQALLDAAGIAPTGDSDEVGASQYLDAVEQLIAEGSERVQLATWSDGGDALSSVTANGVAWSAALGLFVAVGTSGALHTSPEGAIWTSRTSDVSESLFAVASNPAGVLVAVGSNGAATRSTNGTSWADQTSGVGATPLSGVVWHVDKFIAVGFYVTTSPTGTTWTLRTAELPQVLRGVATNGSLAVAVGDAGLLLTSSDGETWTSRTSGTAVNLQDVAWHRGSGLFVAVGASGVIRTSPDGITWTGRTSGVATQLNGITATDNYLIVVGASDVLLASRDGITWRAIYHEIADLGDLAVTWNSLVCVAVGTSGFVSRSLPRLSP